MTEWRDFSTPPEEGQYVFVIYKKGNFRGIPYPYDRLRVIRWEGGLVPEIYSHWMPAPPLPEVIPTKPAFEVPRDGNSYLSWVDGHGCNVVYYGCDQEYYMHYGSEDVRVEEDEIRRYMDANGKWVERE